MEINRPSVLMTYYLYICQLLALVISDADGQTTEISIIANDAIMSNIGTSDTTSKDNFTRMSSTISKTTM